MREIKFRAWIEKDKYMFYQDNQYLNSFVRRVCMFLADMEHESYLDRNLDEYLMQYTGLKDKNGKEIYEGDVVTTDGDNEPLTVRYAEGPAGFFPFWALGNTYLYKVVGNKYENPELLK
jgi:uncharacterized phage protein (TIGR01671 family)